MSGHWVRMVSKAQMILATGSRTQIRASIPSRTVECGHAGFTLIEILLVIGLIAFVAAVLISNFASIADRGDALTTEETLLAAVRRARFIAASERKVSELSFDKENHRLQISIDNEAVETLPLDSSFKETHSAEIRFYLIASSRGLAPPNDARRTSLETKSVKFAADRSSNPFVAEIDLGSGTPERLQFDPFSSLVITREE